MPALEEYLIDTSAYARIWRPELRRQWEDALVAGRVALCAPTAFEILYAARSRAEYERFRTHLRDLCGCVPVPDDAWRRLLDLQAAMAGDATVGASRRRPAGAVDMLVALTAQRHRLTVLHYDADVEAVARHLDVSTRWIAAPGSIA